MELLFYGVVGPRVEVQSLGMAHSFLRCLVRCDWTIEYPSAPESIQQFTAP